MTKKDLDIMYHQEIGDEVPRIDDLTIDESEDFLLISIKDYISWLEHKLLTLYNIQ